jgi:lipopolysaccharide biosynthesis regulator YciM
VPAQGSSKRNLSAGSLLMWAAVIAVLAVTLHGVYKERDGVKAPIVASQMPSASAAAAGSGAPAVAKVASGPEAAEVDATGLLSKRCPVEGDCACVRQLVDELLLHSMTTLALSAIKLGGPSCAGKSEMGDLRAEALAREGDWSSAREIARKLAFEQPENQWAAYALARAALWQDDLKGARSAAERAVSLGRATAYGVLGQIWLKEEKYSEALDALNKALKANQQDVEAHYFVGIVERQQQRYRPAREAFLAALRANKSFADARFQLGDMTQSIGAFDEARHHLQKLSAIVAEDDPRVVELADKLQKGSKKPSPVYTAPGEK